MVALQNYGSDTLQTAGRGTPNAISPASDGQNWSQAAGAAALSVVSDSGLLRGKLTNNTAANVLYLGSRQFTDSDLYVRVLVSSTLVRLSLIARSTAANTYYRADVTGTAFELFLNNGGVGSQIGGVGGTTTVSFAANTYYWIHLQLNGFGDNPNSATNLRANLWADPTAGAGTSPSGEPAGWMVSASDGTLTNPGNFGLHYKATTTGQFAYFDAFTCTDLAAPFGTPTYNVTGPVSPYGATVYVPNNNTPPLPAQLKTDFVGPNAVSSVGWGNGVNLRYQMRWKNVETYQDGSGGPLYDWAIMDDAVQKCNNWGIRIMWPVQAPPDWRLSRDALGSNATLAASDEVGGAYTAGHTYTYLNISALPLGAFIPHKAVLGVNWQANNLSPQENVTVNNSGSYYGQGTTRVAISAWTPSVTHVAGEQIWEATSGSNPNGGPQYGSASDYSTFCTAVSTRYTRPTWGKIDLYQAENENYDSANRVGAQGANGTGGSSPLSWSGLSTWDNGGAILAPVYLAVRSAVKATHPQTPVFPCSVRKTPNTGRQHVLNWLAGLASQVSAQGGVLDGVDFHYYRDGTLTVNADGSLSVVTDPTQSTYGVASPHDLAHMNAPSVSQEVADIKSILASYSFPAGLVMAGETGWPIYDDGGGPVGTLASARNAGQPGGYTTLVMKTPWKNQNGNVQNSGNIPDATPITVDYNNTGLAEVVYAYGQALKDAATIQITTDSRGNGTAQNLVGAPLTQLPWTPAHTHAGDAVGYTGAEVYGATTTTVLSASAQSTYLQAMYDALRTGGANYCFVYSMEPISNVVTTTTNPAWSARPDSITQTIGGVYTYEPAYSMTATYAGTYPTWFTARDIGTRLRLKAVSLRDLGTRIRLQSQPRLRDLATRIIIRPGSTRDLGMRARLSASRVCDLATRISLRTDPAPNPLFLADSIAQAISDFQAGLGSSSPAGAALATILASASGAGANQTMGRLLGAADPRDRQRLLQAGHATTTGLTALSATLTALSAFVTQYFPLMDALDTRYGGFAAWLVGQMAGGSTGVNVLFANAFNLYVGQAVAAGYRSATNAPQPIPMTAAFPPVTLDPLYSFVCGTGSVMTYSMPWTTSAVVGGGQAPLTLYKTSVGSAAGGALFTIAYTLGDGSPGSLSYTTPPGLPGSATLTGGGGAFLGVFAASVTSVAGTGMTAGEQYNIGAALVRPSAY